MNNFENIISAWVSNFKTISIENLTKKIIPLQMHINKS